MLEPNPAMFNKEPDGRLFTATSKPSWEDKTGHARQVRTVRRVARAGCTPCPWPPPQRSQSQALSARVCLWQEQSCPPRVSPAVTPWVTMVMSRRFPSESTPSCERIPYLSSNSSAAEAAPIAMPFPGSFSGIPEAEGWSRDLQEG